MPADFAGKLEAGKLEHTFATEEERWKMSDRSDERRELFWKQLRRADRDVQAWPDYVKQALIKPTASSKQQRQARSSDEPIESRARRVEHVTSSRASVTSSRHGAPPSASGSDRVGRLEPRKQP